MISKELMSLLISVISSWQVIVVTIAIIIYVSIVSSVARVYRRPRISSKPSKRRKKKARPSDAGPAIENSSNDELGLEES
jgi:hypothetical protein